MQEDTKLDQALAQVVLELKAVRSELRQLKDTLNTITPQQEGWLPTIKAAEALNIDGVNGVRHLRDLKDAGVFSEVKGEIRDISKGSRPTWQYHIPSCRKALRRHFSGLMVAK